MTDFLLLPARPGLFLNEARRLSRAPALSAVAQTSHPTAQHSILMEAFAHDGRGWSVGRVLVSALIPSLLLVSSLLSNPRLISSHRFFCLLLFSSGPCVRYRADFRNFKSMKIPLFTDSFFVFVFVFVSVSVFVFVSVSVYVSVSAVADSPSVSRNHSSSLSLFPPQHQIFLPLPGRDAVPLGGGPDCFSVRDRRRRRLDLFVLDCDWHWQCRRFEQFDRNTMAHRRFGPFLC